MGVRDRWGVAVWIESRKVTGWGDGRDAIVVAMARGSDRWGSCGGWLRDWGGEGESSGGDCSGGSAGCWAMGGGGGVGGGRGTWRVLVLARQSNGT